MTCAARTGLPPTVTVPLTTDGTPVNGVLTGVGTTVRAAGGAVGCGWADTRTVGLGAGVTGCVVGIAGPALAA